MTKRTEGAKALTLAALCTVLLAGGLLAEDAKKAAPASAADGDSLFPGLHVETEFTGWGFGGPHESAKWDEYRDVPQGGKVDWLKVDFENEDKSTNCDLRLKNAGLTDMDLLFTAEQYGKWKSTFEFKRTPHNFLNEVGTLYSGIGTGKLRIADSIQAAEQATLTDAAMVSLLRRNLHDGFIEDNISLQRDQFKLSFAFIQLDPISLGIDISHEERQGGRPYGGTFGFSNAVGIVEPIDYGTTDASLWAAYDKGCLHAKVFYGFDYFENRIGAVNYDNPFRNVDGTSPAAYAVSRQSGAREGENALYPDNLEHRVGFDFGWDAPAKTRVTTGFTATWRESREELEPYTVNTAIRAGAISGDGTPDTPFDAFNKTNLPQGSFIGQVATQRFNFQVTNRAIDHLEIRAKYRLYNFDNESDQITFPGQVRVDAVWEPGDLSNQILQYTKHEGGLEFACSLPWRTTATVGYNFVDMERDHREVDSSWDHIALCALDSKPVSWIDAKASYSHTWRRTDNYDFHAPEPDNPTPSQLPFLRKYDEAPFDRDRVNVQISFPTESVTPTAGYTIVATDYDTSFGVSFERRQAWNAGVDADPWERLHVSVTGNLEFYNGDQQSRQWNPFNPALPVGPTNGVGDPYFTDTGEFSFSNWQAHILDRVVTLNTQETFHLILEKLDLETSYTFMHAGEGIGFDSPIGNPAAPTAQGRDNNPRNEGLFNLAQGDNSTWHNVRVQFRWKVRKNLTVVFGYLFEEFDHQDYRNRGFTAVPTTPSGSYAALFSLNREPDTYESHAGFISVIWNF